MTPDKVAAEAVEIHRNAEAVGCPIRLIGSLAIARRCPNHSWLMSALGRRPPQDADFVTYSAHESQLDALLAERGYVLHPSVRHSREWGVQRLIYTHPESGMKVDLFLDELVMAHTIDFRERLEVEDLTVSATDLLLSKLQIYRITSNDLIDLIVLLAELETGSGSDQIDLGRLQSVLGDDWGFAHGALLNLARLAEEVAELPALEPEIAQLVTDRATRLIREIEALPKSLRWRIRARIGTRAPWYEHVDDVDI